jgi:hypothetical protein
LYLFFFLSIFAKSQSPLTIGQVYDYTIGDAICYTRTPNLSGPPTSYTQTFLQKTVKVDTIIYVAKYNYYTPAACQTCSPSAGTYTSNFTIIHLNSLFQLATADTCTVVKDTIYINGCGTTLMKRNNNFGGSCFEPTIFNHEVYEGVGGFYSYTIYNSLPPGYGYQTELTYYHKVGQPRCGGNGQPLIIKENELWNQISIFPNPITDNKLVIKNSLKEKINLSLYAIDGQKVYGVEAIDSYQELQLNFVKGIYFLKLTNSNSNESIVHKVIFE